MNSKSLFWLLTTVLLTTALSAKAQQPTKIPRIAFLAGTPFPVTRTVSRRSSWVCARLAMRKGKTLSLSGDLRKGKTIAFRRSPPNSWVSK